MYLDIKNQREFGFKEMLRIKLKKKLIDRQTRFQTAIENKKDSIKELLENR
jgi:hypothetical protein